MNPPRTILVPTDFSPPAEHALDYATVLAAKLDAKITLLHAITLPTLASMEAGLVLTPEMIQTLHDGAAKALDKLAADRREKATFAPPQLKTGDPRMLIEETAREINADLVVIGTHGRRGIRRFFLGSVAESVVRSAPCPVLAVHAKDSTK